MVTVQEIQELKELELLLKQKEQEAKDIKSQVTTLNKKLVDKVLWSGVTSGEVPGVAKFELKTEFHIGLPGGQEALIEFCKANEQLAGLVHDKVESKTFSTVMVEELKKTFSLPSQVTIFPELKLKLKYKKPKKGDEDSDRESDSE